jgi:hypothetical protein
MEKPELKVISTKEFIDNALQNYNPATEAIEKLRKQYATIKIASTKDKEGYKAVADAIAVLTKYRTSVEKTRKELKDVALVYGRAVDGEAKRITNELLAIENPLRDNKDAIDQAIADEKAAEARRLAERFNKRTNELFTLGFSFNGREYVMGDTAIKPDTIQHAEEEEWSEIAAHIAMKAEEHRQAKQTEEAERKKLEDDRKALADKMAEIERMKAELEAKEKALTAPTAPPAAPPDRTPDRPTPPPAPWGKPAPQPINDSILPDGPTDDAPDVTEDYRKGYNDACRDVLNILKSPDKFTRETLRNMIYELQIA